MTTTEIIDAELKKSATNIRTLINSKFSMESSINWAYASKHHTEAIYAHTKALICFDRAYHARRVDLLTSATLQVLATFQNIITACNSNAVQTTLL